MKKPNWEHIKIIAIQWVIFTMIVSAYALWTLNKENQELRQENAILKNTNEEIMKQINQDSIILKMEKK